MNEATLNELDFLASLEAPTIKRTVEPLTPQKPLKPKKPKKVKYNPITDWKNKDFTSNLYAYIKQVVGKHSIRKLSANDIESVVQTVCIALHNAMLKGTAIKFHVLLRTITQSSITNVLKSNYRGKRLASIDAEQLDFFNDNRLLYNRTQHYYAERLLTISDKEREELNMLINKTMNPQEFAKLINVSTEHCRRMIRAGTIEVLPDFKRNQRIPVLKALKALGYLDMLEEFVK